MKVFALTIAGLLASSFTHAMSNEIVQSPTIAENPTQVDFRFAWVNVFNLTDREFSYTLKLVGPPGRPGNNVLPAGAIGWNKIVHYRRPSSKAEDQVKAVMTWNESIDGVPHVVSKVLLPRVITSDDEIRILEKEKKPAAAIGTTYYVEIDNGRFVVNP